MKRRDFIKESAKLAAGGLALTGTSNCKDLHEFYSYDTVTLSNGITWTNFQLAVDIGASGTGFDASVAYSPHVIKDGNLYRMWYTGRDGGGTVRIFYGESSNGVNWSNLQVSIISNSQGVYDTNKAASPLVIKDGSIYKMWYSGSDGTNWRILYCESNDGINWYNYLLSVDISSQGALDITHVENASVINVKGLGKMWYSGFDGTNWRILYCESY